MLMAQKRKKQIQLLPELGKSFRCRSLEHGGYGRQPADRSAQCGQFTGTAGADGDLAEQALEIK